MVPGYSDVEGNDVASTKAKEAAKLRHIDARTEGRAVTQAVMDTTRESPTAAGRLEAYRISIAFLKRRVTEAKWRDNSRWTKASSEHTLSHIDKSQTRHQPKPAK